MPHCFVLGCKTSDKRRSAELTFHSIPKNNKEVWLSLIGRDPNTFVVQHRVCSLHFKENDFEKIGIQKRLKPHVLPTLYLRIKPQPISSSEKLPTASTDVQCSSPSIIRTSIKEEPSFRLFLPPEVTKTEPLSDSETSSNFCCTRNLIRAFHSYSRSPNNSKIYRKEKSKRKKKIHRLKQSVVNVKNETFPSPL